MMFGLFRLRRPKETKTRPLAVATAALMYWMFGAFPEVTWTGWDQFIPLADEDSSTASSAPGPLAFQTWNMRPAMWSPDMSGRQQRMPAGPPPMFLAMPPGLSLARPARGRRPDDWHGSVTLA